tara:strand:+ start:19 stop:639 length:621 start_codon:yes stop_codon:yes gene_type:complete
MTDIKLHKFDLDKIPKKISEAKIIGVDTEMRGLDVHRDPLCLVQISSGNDDCHIVQLNRDNYNAPNLVKILLDKNKSFIFHYARADLGHLKKYLKITMNNVECTRTMSRLARTYSDKHGLKDLVKEFVGIDLSKKLQTSDFGGKLTDKQLTYCANDVIYLHSIFSELEKILLRENRIKLYKDTIGFINTRVDLDLASFKEDIFAHS